jgi:hypothetical protein
MRGGTAYSNSIEALKFWFDNVNRVDWVLMSGFQENINQKAMIYRQSDETMTKEDSWELLRQMLEMNASPGARFTVFAANNEHGNRGFYQKVQLGEAPSPYGWANPGIAGAGASPVAYGMVSKAEVATMMQEQRKLWELEKKVEDLENNRATVGGIGDVLKEKLMESDFQPVIDGIMAMIGAFAQGFIQKNQPPVAVSVQGGPLDHQQPPADQTAPGESGYAYDANRIVPCLDLIRPHFGTEDEFYTFMEKIAAKFAENPAMYKMLIK